MNRRLLFAIAASIAAALPIAPAAAADVGVSVSIGQPGFYGRIDIGDIAPPAVIYSQPVIIAPAPIAVVQRPIYLRVPPGHAKNWSKHCARYNACSQRTYFVQDAWYHNVYAPARGRRHHDAYRANSHRPDAHRHGKPSHYRGDDHRGNKHRGDKHRGDKHSNRNR